MVQVTPVLPQRMSGRRFSTARRVALARCCSAAGVCPNQPSLVILTSRSSAGLGKLPGEVAQGVFEAHKRAEFDRRVGKLEHMYSRAGGEVTRDELADEWLEHRTAGDTRRRGRGGEFGGDNSCSARPWTKVRKGGVVESGQLAGRHDHAEEQAVYVQETLMTRNVAAEHPGRRPGWRRTGLACPASAAVATPVHFWISSSTVSMASGSRFSSCGILNWSAAKRRGTEAPESACHTRRTPNAKVAAMSAMVKLNSQRTRLRKTGPISPLMRRTMIDGHEIGEHDEEGEAGRACEFGDLDDRLLPEERDSERIPAKAAEQPLAHPLVHQPRAGSGAGDSQIAKGPGKAREAWAADENGAHEPRPERKVEREKQGEQRRESEQPAVFVKFRQGGAEPEKGAREKDQAGDVTQRGFTQGKTARGPRLEEERAEEA